MVVDKDVNFCPCCGSRLVEETDEIRAEIERQEEEGAQYFGEGQYVEKRVMKSKTAGIIGYALGLLGVVIAYFKGDPEDPLVKFHINQSIVIHAAMLVLLALPLPILSGVLRAAFTACGYQQIKIHQVKAYELRAAECSAVLMRLCVLEPRSVPRFLCVYTF